jgi:hypothetical protein
MKHILNTKLLLCALALVFATSARAQEHRHQTADSARAMPMDHGGGKDMDRMQAMMPQMMRMHDHMMTDSVLHNRMMADPEMRAMMDEMMGGEREMGAMRERMATMSSAQRQAKMQQMHAGMMARMESMPPADRQAMLQRMSAMHNRMMADPAVRERMMADPEMHEMMEQMREGGMMMDHTGMEGMDHTGMDHDALMALHQRMMADPQVHAAMQADPEMKALMMEMMPSMDHSRMAGMNHEMPMDADARAAMMAQMRERMQAMSPEEHAAFMVRMESVHRRLLSTPAVHQRMQADPEMRRMMEAMPGGMPGMEGMDHSQMGGMNQSGTDGGSMQGMDHGSMNGMDHSQMSGAEHAAGVAMQRRNAGASNGDEREESSTVGPQAFDASATADRFHAALASGDRAAMEALLAPDAVVLEGGAHESRAEYLSHHFARDVQALAGTTPEPLYRRTGVAGDAAWVASTQRIGDAVMAELLVMKQTPDGWRVAAVHWSSARK